MFQTSKERSKWAAVSAGADSSLDKLSQGIASTKDLKTIGDAISRYDELARSVFDQAVDSMAAGAREIVAAVEADRAQKGKKPLSEESAERLLDRAMNRQLVQRGPELAATLSEVLAEQLETMDGKLDYLVKASDANSGQMNGIGSLVGKRGRGPDKQQRKRRGVASVGDLVGKGQTNPEDPQTQTMPAGQPAGGQAQNDPAQRAVTRNPQTSPWQQFKTFLDKMWSRDDKRKDKEKDGWWRKFKQWVGVKKEKVKDFMSNPWVKGLMAALGVALFSPQLYADLIEKAKSIFTWDNVVKAGEWAMEQIVSKGPELLKWVWDVAKTVGKAAWNMMKDAGAWIVDKVRSYLPTWMGGYTEKEKSDKAAELAKGPKNTDPTEVSGPGGSGASDTPAGAASNPTTPPAANPGSYEKAARGADSPQADVSSLVGRGQEEGGTANYSASTTNEAPTITMSDGRQVVVNGGDAGTTRSVSNTEVTDVAPAVTSASPESGTAKGNDGQPGSVSSAKIGMGSFGYTAGVNDQLSLINLRVLGG